MRPQHEPASATSAGSWLKSGVTIIESPLAGSWLKSNVTIIESPLLGMVHVPSSVVVAFFSCCFFQLAEQGGSEKYRAYTGY